MRFSTLAVIALVGLAAVQASPARTNDKKSIKDDSKIDAAAEQKDRFKKSLGEQAKSEDSNLKLEEAGDDKERAKKSTTTFCVEIRPGSNEPVRTECGCNKEKIIEKTEYQPAPAPVPAPAPLPVHASASASAATLAPAPAPVPVPAPKPEPMKEEPKPEPPAPQIVHVVRPPPQPQFIHVVRPELEPVAPTTHHVVHVVPKPQPQPQPCAIQVIRPEPVHPIHPIHVVNPKPEPCNVHIVHAPRPRPTPHVVNIVESAPEPAPQPQKIVNVVHALPQPIPAPVETTYHVIKPQPAPQPAPQPEPCEIHHYVQPAAPKPAKIVNVVHPAKIEKPIEPAPIPKPQPSFNVLPTNSGCSDKQPVVLLPSNPMVFYPQHSGCQHHPFVQCDCHTKGSYRDSERSAMMMMDGSEGAMNAAFRHHHKKNQEQQVQQPIVLLSQPEKQGVAPVTVQCNPSIVPLSDTASEYYVTSSARSNQNLMEGRSRNTFLTLQAGSYGGGPTYPATYGGDYPGAMGYPSVPAAPYPSPVIPAGISIHSLPGMYRNNQQSELLGPEEPATKPDFTYVMSEPGMIYENEIAASSEARWPESDTAESRNLEAEDMMRSRAMKSDSSSDLANGVQMGSGSIEDFQPFLISGPRNSRSNKEETMARDKSKDKERRKRGEGEPADEK